jgi:hypothetical protein
MYMRWWPKTEMNKGLELELELELEVVVLTTNEQGLKLRQTCTKSTQLVTLNYTYICKMML